MSRGFIVFYTIFATWILNAAIFRDVTRFDRISDYTISVIAFLTIASELRRNR